MDPTLSSNRIMGRARNSRIVSASRESDPEQILDKSKKERNRMMELEDRQTTINEPHTQTKGEWLETRPGEHCLIRMGNISLFDVLLLVLKDWRGSNL